MLSGLALCAGVGGFELGLRLALGPGYRTVCYVEREAYAAGRVAALALQGYLDGAPIWDDLRTFDGLPWRGRVDIITAGFPCQPFSQAGPRTGVADPRWLWPRIIEIIRDVRPAYVFLENSPQITKQALAIILGDLARAGFDAEWDVFCAAEAGFPHLRRRFFLLAAHPDRVRQQQQSGMLGEGGRRVGDGDKETPADAIGLRGIRTEALGSCEAADGRTGDGATPDASRPPECAFWCAQSGVCVVDDGSPYRLDQLRALGNAVVPAVVAQAWRELYGRLMSEGSEFGAGATGGMNSGGGDGATEIRPLGARSAAAGPR